MPDAMDETGDPATTARRALPLLDLTDLDDGCTADDVRRLAARAVTPHGVVAALCVWPRFARVAREALAGTGVRVATVVNFPAGIAGAAATADEAEAALASGADEIDTVIPWATLGDGPTRTADEIASLRAALDRLRPGVVLKAILETGMIGDTDAIRAASHAALGAGADFLKTSTGKVPTGATPEAAEIMLEALKDHGSGGFKASGGVRTLADAALYLGLADRVLGPDWATPETFRFGASGLLGALLSTLDGADAAVLKARSGY